MGFRATLNFRKFKVALNPMYRIFLNFAKSCVLSYAYQMLIIFNKLTSVFYASVMLLIINFVITLSK